MTALWVADGVAANVWKRGVGNAPISAVGSGNLAGYPGSAAQVEWAVDLKAGSSSPPVLRVVGVGPDNQSASNVMRQRAINVRDKALGH